MTAGRRARTARWAGAVVLTGVAAGVSGALLTLVLHLVQHLAYGYAGEPFAVGSQQSSPARRLLAMTAGGAAVGIGWWVLRRWGRGGTSVPAALDDPAHRLAVPATTADAVLQIAAVGAGASLGREGAPRQVAAALADWLSARLRLSPEQRRLLIACGAGAGLAAVYNVPVGGVFFTLELLLRSVRPAEVVAAAVTSGIATVVAWPVVSRSPTYVVPRLPVSWSLAVAALLLGPVAGLLGWAFRRAMRAAHARRPVGWRLPLVTTAVFAAVGAVAGPYPLVLGNGKGPAGLAFDGALPLGTLAVLLALKPLATAACMRSGATGGLLTPAVATGALLGAVVAAGWLRWWPGSPVGAFAVVGAAGVLAVTHRAPLTAAVLALEFTHATPALIGPVLLAVAGSHATVHALLDRRTAPPPSFGTPRT